MSRYETSHSWGGWVLGVCLLISLPGPAIAVIKARSVEEAVPAFLLALYVIAVFTWNRTFVVVSAEGVVLRYGPLFTGERERRVARSEIATVYVRRKEVGGKTKQVFWRAGVATKAGYWFDIGEAANSEAEAEAVVKALGWTMGIERIYLGPPKSQGMGLRLMLRLAVPAGLCGLWAAYT